MKEGFDQGVVHSIYYVTTEGFDQGVVHSTYYITKQLLAHVLYYHTLLHH